MFSILRVLQPEHEANGFVVVYTCDCCKNAIISEMDIEPVTMICIIHNPTDRAAAALEDCNSSIKLYLSHPKCVDALRQTLGESGIIYVSPPISANRDELLDKFWPIMIELQSQVL